MNPHELEKTMDDYNGSQHLQQHSAIHGFMQKLHQFPVMISIYKWTYQRFLVWAFRFLSVLRAVSIDGILWHQIRGQCLHDPVSLLSWLGTVQMFYSLNDNKHKCQQH